ncbi:RidA family protein [Cohnella silvisoli]|uniref:RidA family protein n=1 Tax=Cohnella silvisoli TaxID=2873699 RepID=A0ABV1KY31_9BACL|nr:RidA family protein [Cohnella silvisoli]MCD9021846.1 RidA family protein [Cohnella silvisoli]
MEQRMRVSTGSPWEPVVGYCRAIRVGSLVEVAGTTSMKDGKVVFKGDPYNQTRYILEIIDQALQEVGAAMEDVIRTRMYVTNITQWEEIGRAHGEWFKDIRPVATMVEVKALIDPELLIEIEVQAVVHE